jgi:hypothetical protein
MAARRQAKLTGDVDLSAMRLHLRRSRDVSGALATLRRMSVKAC